MAAGVTDRLWEIADIVLLVEKQDAPAKRGQYKRESGLSVRSVAPKFRTRSVRVDGFRRDNELISSGMIAALPKRRELHGIKVILHSVLGLAPLPKPPCHGTGNIMTEIVSPALRKPEPPDYRQDDENYDVRHRVASLRAPSMLPYRRPKFQTDPLPRTG
jgi:hypothetical protein